MYLQLIHYTIYLFDQNSYEKLISKSHAPRKNLWRCHTLESAGGTYKFDALIHHETLDITREIFQSEATIELWDNINVERRCWALFKY